MLAVEGHWLGQHFRVNVRHNSYYSGAVSLWAHSRDRVNDAMPLRHRSHTLTRAHLRPSRFSSCLMLREPLLVRPALLQHPVQIATELPGRGRRGLRFPLRAQETAIMPAHRPRRPLERRAHCAKDPLQPAIAASPYTAVRGFPARAPCRRDETRRGGQLVARAEAADRPDLRMKNERAPNVPTPGIVSSRLTTGSWRAARFTWPSTPPARVAVTLCPKTPLSNSLSAVLTSDDFHSHSRVRWPLRSVSPGGARRDLDVRARRR